MTRDEVMALTDEALRIKAIEALGWQRGAVLNGSVQTWYRTLSGGEGEAGWGHTECRDERDFPDYPHDIAAAWELIEEFSEATMTLQTLTEDMKPDPEPPHYPCEEVNFDLGPNPDWPNSQVCEFRRNGESWAHTTARAITRAFILAMEDSE